MRQERISKTTTRRRTRAAEIQPPATAPTMAPGAPDLGPTDELLNRIDEALAGA